MIYLLLFPHSVFLLPPTSFHYLLWIDVFSFSSVRWPQRSCIFKIAAYLISSSWSRGTSTLYLNENATIWEQLRSLTPLLSLFVFLLSLGAHAVFNHERMSHWEKSWEKKKKPREIVIKRTGGRPKKCCNRSGHYGEVRRPIPNFGHPISWEPRGPRRWRRRCCQVDEPVWWTQRGWTGRIPFLPAYLWVTSLASSTVCLPGRFRRKGTKKQKCTTLKVMEPYGHFSHFKEYLMLHIFIFVQR